jgi:hypothetical protein
VDINFIALLFRRNQIQAKGLFVIVTICGAKSDYADRICDLLNFFIDDGFLNKKKYPKTKSFSTV